jgi:hypothetical protein
LVTPSTGTSYKLFLLKFYLSSPVLLESDGTRVPAQVVQPTSHRVRTGSPWSISTMQRANR